MSFNIPYSSSPIKSVQRGTSSTGAVAISAVDTSKTVVNLLSSIGFGLSSGSLTLRENVSLVLTSSTVLTVSSGSYAALSWEVIEYK